VQYLSGVLAVLAVRRRPNSDWRAAHPARTAPTIAPFPEEGPTRKPSKAAAAVPAESGRPQQPDPPFTRSEKKKKQTRTSPRNAGRAFLFESRQGCLSNAKCQNRLSFFLSFSVYVSIDQSMVVEGK
jgi:hypothetical protein